MPRKRNKNQKIQKHEGQGALIFFYINYYHARVTR